MRGDFVQINGDRFEVNGKPMFLRGYTFGSWMNLEHFMMGLPGTNSMIFDAFADVYGVERADSFFETLTREMVKESDVAFLKRLGTNTVRIPFGYHWFLDDQNPGVFLERGFKQLDRVVEMCSRQGMYMILDLHSAPGAQNNDWHADSITGQSLFWKFACFREQTCRLWQQIAARYRENPMIVGYDVLNEPGYGLSRELFNGFYRDVLKSVRAVDPDHIVFMEGDDFGRSFDLFDEPDDPQTTYAVHFYPFVLEENVLDPAMPEQRRTEIYEQIFYRQLKIRERFHRPIWCGESGYNIPDDQEAFTAKLLLKNIELCEQNNLSWSLWTYKDARRMGIVIPKQDSPWMRLRARMEEHWTHEWEQKTSMEITKAIGVKYYQPLDDRLAYDLDFRVRSILHRIETEQILKPILRSIPWEEMRVYPQSFAFENCEQRTQVVKAVGDFIAKHPH